jgi:hypothetical protein
MKRFALLLLSIAIFGCSTKMNKNLVGDWEIIEFRLIGRSGDSTSDEKTLRDAGAIWDLDFSKNGNFRQSFNMRTPEMKMEVEQGTCKTSADTLTIELEIDTITSTLIYNYEIENEVLTLTLAPEEVNSKIITKFRKK